YVHRCTTASDPNCRATFTEASNANHLIKLTRTRSGSTVVCNGSDHEIVHDIQSNAPGPDEVHVFATVCQTPPNHFTSTPLTYEQYKDLKVVMILNTPGTGDGTLKAWYGGSVIVDKTNVIFRESGNSANWTQFWLGAQQQRFNGEALNAVHDWDEVGLFPDDQNTGSAVSCR
ncbi:MAG: hypothetical protein ACREB3_01240, partial [Burkholderiales bacterium]